MAKKKSLLDGIKKDLRILRAPKGRAQERRRAELLHRVLRWVVQIAFFVAFPGVWSAAFTGVRNVCQQLGAAAPLELSSFVALLLALLAYTCVFGRFFCGYACAFGTLGDAVYALAAPLRHALGLGGKRIPVAARRALQLVKYVVLAAVAWLCFTGLWPSVSAFSPWGAFAGLRAGSVEGISAVAFGALAAVMVGMAFEERFFCQFLCPFGAVFSLLPVLPVSHFRRNRPTCAKRCNRCQDRCPVAVHPDRGDLRSGECIACGRCADGCPLSNVAVWGQSFSCSGLGTVIFLQRIGDRFEAAAGEGKPVGKQGDRDRAAGATQPVPKRLQENDRPQTAGATQPVPKRLQENDRPQTAGRKFGIIGTEVSLTLLKAVILAALCYAFA